MNLAILQARMSSTRLPGKVLRPILGEPMIARQIERLRRARRIDKLVVATSTDVSDDLLADFIQELGIDVYRGDLKDVLSRYVETLETFGPADIVIRLTADCPLTDPVLIDTLIELRAATDADIVSLDVHPSFPQGLDAEIIRSSALRAAGAEAELAYDREHVTPFIYARPDRFKIGSLTQQRDESHVRWTVDTPEDFAFVSRVYEALYPTHPTFLQEDIRALDFGLTHHDALVKA